MATTNPLGIDLDHYKWGFHDSDEKYVFKARKGLDREIVNEISHMKGEPDWMRAFRLHSLEHFQKRPMPTWGADLGQIDFNDIYYYLKPTEGKGHTWDDVPADIKRTFDRLGIPEAEKKYLAGVGAQYESESVYHNLKEEWEKLGVIFLDTDSALKQHPALFQEYFGTVVPPEDNKLAALNSAVWSGGSFVYVPEGVKVDIPLQAYFRINAEKAGQFERTLIICEPGSYVHYVEGCLPPDELVSKGDRWVHIESIAPGDAVLDSDGHEATVKSVRVRPFKGSMLTIRPISRGNAFRVTPEHPVMAVKRRDVAVKRRPRKHRRIEVDTEKLVATRPQFVPAGQLEVGDFLVFPISKLAREHSAYTPGVMRLLGYYLAEGSAFVHNKLKQPVVSLTFNERERAYIEDAKALIRESTGKRAMEVRRASRHGIEVRVYSRELMDLCVAECGKGAADKQLSKAIMELPPALQAHLLETYFRGDGSVYLRRRHTMVRAATASRQLAWQLQELLARQGHYATISVRKGGKDTMLGREITRRDQYVLYYSPDKQQSEVRRGDGCFFVPVKEISRAPYDGPVFNFELTTAPNAYVARGFAVHNCTAPIYTTDSLHSAVVEIIVKEGARCRYTTIQNWSTNTYNLVTKRAVAYRDATMEWVDGNLGCLTGDSKVLLNNDVRPISEVQTGDTVYSVDGDLNLTRHKVLAKKYSGRQRVFRLRGENHREIKATASHPFLALSKRGKHVSLGWKPLERLTTGDHVAIAGNVPDSGTPKIFDPTPARGTKPVTLPSVSTEDLMWLLGLYVGDGYLDRNRVYFAVPARDPAHPRMMALLKSLFGAEAEVRGSVARINSAQLRDFLTAIGFAGTARQKRVPDWVYRLPKAQRLGFLEGYIAADGYRRANHTNLSITSANRDLLEDLKALAISCGVHFGERAYDQPVHFTRVAAIEPLGVEDTWDLEIAGSHNFVADGFVVHNSKITMKYPSVYMVEPGAKAEILSVAFAGKGQHQDPGGKVVHAAPHTQSSVVSKSISKDGGRAGYRGLVKIYPGSVGSKCAVRCDALILDDRSRSDTYPYMEIEEQDVSITHEATVSKVSDEQLFYLMSRGVKADEAMNMIVRGFIEPIVKELPLEYAVELNRLIALEMEGSVG